MSAAKNLPVNVIHLSVIGHDGLKDYMQCIKKTSDAFLKLRAYVDAGLNGLMVPCGLPGQSIPFNLVTAVGLLAARGRLVGHGLYVPGAPELQEVANSSWMVTTTVDAVTDHQVDWFKVRGQGTYSI